MKRTALTAAAALALAAAASGCARGRAAGRPPRAPAGDPRLEAPLLPERRPAPVDSRAGDSMKLHVIDVGQGAAHLLEFPCGAALVDAGAEKSALHDGEKALVDYLDRFFERRRDLGRTLALLVVTHPHADHTRGLALVLARYRVLNVLDGGGAREDEGGRSVAALHEWLARHPRVGHMDLDRRDIDPRGGATGPVIDPIGACAASEFDPILHALWSGAPGESGEPADDSVVVRVDFGDTSILLPGDLELPGIAGLLQKYEASPALLDADVYVVANHGSPRSSTTELVARVSPRVAVLSAGRYEPDSDGGAARAAGHPSQTALDHLTQSKGGVRERRARPVAAWIGQRAGGPGRPADFARRTITAAVYATSWDGTVVLTGYANGWIEVATER